MKGGLDVSWVGMWFACVFLVNVYFSILNSTIIYFAHTRDVVYMYMQDVYLYLVHTMYTRRVLLFLYAPCIHVFHVFSLSI